MNAVITNQNLLFLKMKIISLKNYLQNKLRGHLKSLLGRIFNPPMYSASKHKGKPLYIYARNNMTVERQYKIRHIYALKFNSLENDILNFTVTCSPGTYIRTPDSRHFKRMGSSFLSL